MITIAVLFWYVFMCVLSFRLFELLKIGCTQDWYDDNNVAFEDCLGAFLMSIIWPVSWIMIGFQNIAKKIVKQIEKELIDKK